MFFVLNAIPCPLYLPSDAESFFSQQHETRSPWRLLLYSGRMELQVYLWISCLKRCWLGLSYALTHPTNLACFLAMIIILESSFQLPVCSSVLPAYPICFCHSSTDHVSTVCRLSPSVFSNFHDLRQYISNRNFNKHCQINTKVIISN